MKRRNKTAAALLALGTVLSAASCTDDKQFATVYGPPPENYYSSAAAERSIAPEKSAPKQYEDANGEIVEDDDEYEIEEPAKEE